MAIPSYQALDFVREVESQYDISHPETFWNCEAAINKLVASHAIQRWLNEQLNGLLADPTSDGAWGSQEVTLHRNRRWCVSIALFSTARRYIHALPCLAIYVPLSGALSVERYQLPNSFRNDVFDPTVRVEPMAPLIVKQHEPVRLETSHCAYYFPIAEPVVVLRLETAPIWPLEWLFSRQTFRAWQANDAALGYTQLRVAAYVLGKIAHQSSINPLRDLARHPHHAVRWAAIQNLGRLNRSEALVKIKEAINDPHPHVRRAAQKTLERLEGKVV